MGLVIWFCGRSTRLIKIFKFIGKNEKKTLKNKPIAIRGVLAESTLIGRKKVENLKKIGKRKREGVTNIF